MNINVLKDYCKSLSDVDTDALLSCWGVWVSTATDHLGYKSPAYALNGKVSSRCIWLNDRELELLDQAVGVVRRTDEQRFKALVLRYVYRMSIRKIMRRLDVQSTNKVYSLLAMASADFRMALRSRIYDNAD